jgi:hypothetical protein
MLSTIVKQKVQDAINKDELMTRLAPFFKKHIEDVLSRVQTSTCSFWFASPRAGGPNVVFIKMRQFHSLIF